MSRRRSDIDADLRDLYDQVPGISGCKGKCWISCGPIDMSDRERQRIREHGIEITPRQQALEHKGDYWCEALGPDGRCTVYEDRPMVCRLWGVARSCRCPYGCVPDGGFLPEDEFSALLMKSRQAGGSSVTGHVSFEEFMARRAHPVLGRAVTEYVRARTEESDGLRAATYAGDLPPEITGRPVHRWRKPRR
jgi:hypothetical protein